MNTIPKFLRIKDTIVSTDNLQEVSHDCNISNNIWIITFKYHGGGTTAVKFFSLDSFGEYWEMILFTFGFDHNESAE